MCCVNLPIPIKIKITLATPSVRAVRHHMRSTDSGVRQVRIQVSGWLLSTMGPSRSSLASLSLRFLTCAQIRGYSHTHSAGCC